MENKETDNTRTRPVGEFENIKQWLYFITLKPNWSSLIKKSKGSSELMRGIFARFCIKNGAELKLVDASEEYDSKNVCHIHGIFASKYDIFSFQHIDKMSLAQIKNIKGVYVDIRTLQYKDLDYVIKYINKEVKRSEVIAYYEKEYGFI